MQIVRTEVPTGTENRTRRETIVPLFTGSRPTVAECYFDCSESEGWEWSADPRVCTWDIQVEAARQFIVPFQELDSAAAGEQAEGSDERGGVFFFPFNNNYLMMGEDLEDGDLNSSNWSRKFGAFVQKYFGRNDGKPMGGTEVMEAVKAGDRQYMGEYGSKPRAERDVRARVLWTDGILSDARKFKGYLEDAKLTKEGFGGHGEWDEVWGIGILGERGGYGEAAAAQYRELAKDHPWIHVYYFEGVVNAAEVAEDMAFALVPVQA
jgi:hypothetical protein